MCELVIFAQKGVVSPAIVDRIEWTTERVGVAGKLTFKTIFDENNTFEEGDVIQFKYNNTPIFKGVIFSIKRDKDLGIDEKGSRPKSGAFFMYREGRRCK